MTQVAAEIKGAVDMKGLYARAAKALPDAVAISIMSGVQTQEGEGPYEWWTILVYSTPIGPDAVITTHVDGKSFGAALGRAIYEVNQPEEVPA